MKVYDYTDGEVKEIEDIQYDFLQVVITHCGRMDMILKEFPVPADKLEAWQKDPVFWPLLQGYITILVKSKGLSLDKLREFMMDVIAGKKDATKAQLAICNAAVRVLLPNNTKAQFQATITPESTKITFNDGLDETPTV